MAWRHVLSCDLLGRLDSGLSSDFEASTHASGEEAWSQPITIPYIASESAKKGQRTLERFNNSGICRVVS